MAKVENIYQRAERRKSGSVTRNEFQLEIHGEVVFRQFRRAKMSVKKQGDLIINKYGLRKRNTHWQLFILRGSNVNKTIYKL